VAILEFDLNTLSEAVKNGTPSVENWIGKIFSAKKAKKIENQEKKREIRSLALEFYSNEELAKEYINNPPRMEFAFYDERLTNCAMMWSSCSYNIIDDLNISIKEQHIIDTVYKKFRDTALTKEEYQNFSIIFNQYGLFFEKLCT
jgi:hypothetical protein